VFYCLKNQSKSIPNSSATLKESAMRRLLNILSVTFLLVTVPTLTYSETIDVLIKGVDDGVKTNKQQDYKEAVMNAKLEAIERAGVEISSITKVVNFKTKYDMVESKAEATLLPGFQVMDMGYQSDGTYAVVLSGKLRVEQDAEKGANRRKLVIQEEIQTIEARLAAIKKDNDRTHSRYMSRQQEIHERYMERLKACGNPAYPVNYSMQCQKRAGQENEDALKEADDSLDKSRARLREEEIQLKLRLSELRVELAKYPPDAK
jgi:hypothetical protein